MLAELFTLPRLRTLRPAALRKLSSEGTWRNDADAENVGREENPPVFDFGSLVFAGDWRGLPLRVYVDRVCDL